jgi:hypothetical protein
MSRLILEPTISEIRQDSFPIMAGNGRRYYLATPYTGTQKEMQSRFERACRMTGYLITKGIHAYSPVAHSHPIAQIAKIEGSWQTWQNHCIEELRRSDCLWIVKMTGWDLSAGIAEEYAYARENGIGIITSQHYPQLP